jgi:hypothetical protein
MNVNLEGARSQARLEWDRLEERRRASAAVLARVFTVALVAFAAYMFWRYLAA